MAARRITHCIFDMDGLLLDTEKFYTVVSQEIASRYGKEFTWEIKSKQMGKKALESCRIFVEELGLEGRLTPEQLLVDREDALDALFPSAQLLPGVERLLRHLHAHKIPMALATGSNRRHFELKTTNHKPLFSVFDHIITGDEVTRGKPDPELFNKAAAGFTNNPLSSPAACLVFEDAPSGVQAAKRAGMGVVMVPDDNLAAELREGADEVLISLVDFVPEAWGLPPFDA